MLAGTDHQPVGRVQGGRRRGGPVHAGLRVVGMTQTETAVQGTLEELAVTAGHDVVEDGVDGGVEVVQHACNGEGQVLVNVHFLRN